MCITTVSTHSSFEDVPGDHEHVGAPFCPPEERRLVAFGRHEVAENGEEARAQVERVAALAHERPALVAHDTAVALRVRHAAADVDDLDVAGRKVVTAVGVALRAHALHDDIRARLAGTLRLQLVRGLRDGCEQVDERRHGDVAADAAAVCPVHNDPEQG
jgi:hypothetical protein